MKKNKLLTLVIMDGVGMPKELNVSAVTDQTAPFLQSLAKKYTCGVLEASGEAVGLPDDQMGTSEVGHLTIGAGRIKTQSIVRINKAIKNGELINNEAIKLAMQNALSNNKALHLIGIVSDGGVHSHINHLIELIKIAAKYNLPKVYIHFISDGRDTPPQSAIGYLDQLNEAIQKYKTGEVTDICGRFYALDRDNNWDRVEVFYNAIVNGQAKQVEDIKAGIKQAYENGEKDEFIKPLLKVKDGVYVGKVNKGDSVIMFNYRIDRARQITRALSNDNCFDWTTKLNLTLITMTNYDASLKGVHIVFEPEPSGNILSEVLSERGYSQLKIAETEKFAHLTYFFNSGADKPFKNEKQMLISSEKLVTYDVNPKMSAEKITQFAIDSIDKNKYNFIAINYANGDMVGHSGNYEATKIAVKCVDNEVKKIAKKVLDNDGILIVTADHGNSDIMFYPDGTPHKSHTMNRVPFIIAGKGFENGRQDLTGTLANISPTILKILGEEIPKEMTASPLI